MTECNDCGRDALEAQVQGFRDLIEVAQAVVSTIDLDTVLQAILTSAMRFADTPAGSIALFDARRRELSLHAHAGLTAEFVKRERWEVMPGGLTEQVLAGGEVLFVNDSTKSPFFNNPVALKEGIKSLICIPLVVHEKNVGILYLDDFVPRTFDQDKMKLLSILASFAAMAIENAKLHRRTKVMAITDGLTGLHNRRYFKQVFDLELDRAKRYDKPLSIIIMDVDNFKKFNDTFGHPNGDRALMAVGRILLETLRKVDFAFRYGGEEFVALLPETGMEFALQAAERLREAIERKSASMLKDITANGVTASIGVASFPRDGSTTEELLRRVDELLYRAKEFGKNRVYHNEESAPA